MKVIEHNRAETSTSRRSRRAAALMLLGLAPGPVGTIQAKLSGSLSPTSMIAGELSKR